MEEGSQGLALPMWLGYRVSMRRASLFLLAALCACGDEEEIVSAPPRPTEVGAHPDDFLGEVGCSRNPGAMQSYVLTLIAWDDAEDVTPFVVGSTGPAPCSLIAGFRDVIVVGKRYSAEIDGYEEAPSELAPFGDPSSGAREMVMRESGALAVPRWTTRCATGASNAVTSLLNELVRVRPCEPLRDASSSDTAIAIGPETVLGDDPCSVADTIDIQPDPSGLAPLACDAEPIVFDAIAGERYSFYVTADSADGTTRGSECFVVAVEGQTVEPACSTPSAEGSIRVSLAGVETSGGAPVCPAGHYYTVSIGTENLTPVPVPCGAVAQTSSLLPGTYLMMVSVRDAHGIVVTTEPTCAAEVLPGKSVDAICLANR